MPKNAASDEVLAGLENLGLVPILCPSIPLLLVALDDKPCKLVILGPEQLTRLGARLVERVRGRVSRHGAAILALPSDKAEELAEAAAHESVTVRAWSNATDVIDHVRSTIAPPVSGGAPSPGFGRKAKVLAIDDSATYRFLLKKLLLEEGYDVLQAASGEQGLLVLEKEDVDCVLLDRTMAGMGGLETCRAIRSRAKWTNIPVVFLTSSDKRSATLAGFDAGADDYVVKSSDFTILRTRVRAHVRRKVLDDQNRLISDELSRSESMRGRPIGDEAVRAALIEAIHPGQRLRTPATFDLHDTLGSVVTSLRRLAGKATLALECTIAEDVPKQIDGDAAQIRRIVQDFYVHALAFAGTNAAHLYVTLGEPSEKKLKLRFKVEANGADHARCVFRFSASFAK